MKKLLIWGCGDQGIVTMECAMLMKKYECIDFMVFEGGYPRSIHASQFYYEQDVDMNLFFKTYDEVIVATGDNNQREKKTTMLLSMKVPLATIIHPTAFISSSAIIKDGCTILANAVVHTNAVIGSGCIINTGAIIEHDCILDDFINISPRVAIAGHTKIGRKSFLGIGSTVINNIVIGKETTIGAGAVVIHDIVDNTTNVGVPTHIILDNNE